MAMDAFTRSAKFVVPSQSRPIPGREKDMIPNAAGGYCFKDDEKTQLDKYLIFGTDGGTYYLDENEFTIDRIEFLADYIQKDPRYVLERTARLSERGRVLRNDYAIAVLALAWVMGFRREVGEVFDRVIRIPTHLYRFLEYVKVLQGGKLRTNRTFKAILRNHIQAKGRDTLVYHALKYQQRNGWSFTDVLRIVHPRPRDEFENRLYGWLLGKKEAPEHPLVEAFIKLRRAKTEEEVVRIIKEYDVTWEFVPGEWLGSRKVWEALLPKLPYQALLRNLGRLSALKVIDDFGSNEAAKYVISVLTDEERIRKSRIHPVQVGLAYAVYAEGEGIRGSLSWTPAKTINEALDEAFIKAFGNVEPIGKRIVVAIDDSGSMTWEAPARVPMKAVEAAALVAVPLLKTEPHIVAYRFSYGDDISRLNIASPDWHSLARQLGEGGGTDIALPIKELLRRKIEADLVVVLTDNETWAGDWHPAEVWERYRQEISPNAKLVVVSMTATPYSVADPQDRSVMQVVGFDASLMKLIREFALV